MGIVRREDGRMFANFMLRLQDEQTMIGYGSSPYDYANGRKNATWRFEHGMPVFTEGVWFHVKIWQGLPTKTAPYDQRQFEPTRSAEQWIDLLLIVRERFGDNLWPREL